MLFFGEMLMNLNTIDTMGCTMDTMVEVIGAILLENEKTAGVMGMNRGVKCAGWRVCGVCGARMRTTNVWTEKARLECRACGAVRHVETKVVLDVRRVRARRDVMEEGVGSKE